VSPTKARLSPGECTSAVAAVVLLVSLVLPWFHEESVGRFSGPGDPSFHPRDLIALTAIPVVAILLAALAAVPLFNAVRRLRTGTSMRPEVNLAVGALAVSLVFFGAALHVGEQGSSLPGRPFVTAGPVFGLGVALVAALATAVGGVLSMWSTRPTRSAPNRPPPTGSS
jgi:fumarate reductase subunit D